MIEFLCPNGHKIHCPDEQAGRPAKCPRCGVKFRIPGPTEAEDNPPPVSDSNALIPELADSSGNVPVPARPRPPKESQIEFLCPKGHHLHGPASLQGRPGECPECGSRFRIPTYEDIPEDTAVEEEISLGGVPGEAELAAVDDLPTLDVADIVAADGSGAGVAVSPLPPMPQGMPAAPSGSATGTAIPAEHPLGETFARLWSAKGQDGRVELHLEGGEVLTPEHFAKNLSRHSHGVFAVKEADGSYTITAVPWDAVTRTLLRGVKRLPKEMEEGLGS